MLISAVFALLGVLLLVYAALATISAVLNTPGIDTLLPVSFLFFLAGIGGFLGFLLLFTAISARRRQIAGWWLSMFILVVGLFISGIPVLNTVGRLGVKSGASSPTEVAFASVTAALFLAATWAMATTRRWFSSAGADPPKG